ncbi:ROK family protein [Microbacterium sp. JZ70]
MTGVRIGLDVGGSKTDAVAVAADGSILARRRSATERGDVGVVDSIVAAVEAVSTRAGSSSITSIGIGIPGQTDGRTVRHAVNLDVRELPLADAVEARCGVPVAVENDVKAAALGAHALAPAAGPLALLNLGTGIAAGVVVDGRLWRGAGGAAGEIGHVPIDPAGPVCACGQTGCIEALAGGRALAARWARPGAFPVRDLLDAADEGHPLALRLRVDFVRGAAAAIRLLALAVDPRRIVLAGGLAALGDRMADIVSEELRRSSAASGFLRSLHLGERIEVLPAGSPAAALGASLIDAPVPV